jgi:hypothetical protein
VLVGLVLLVGGAGALWMVWPRLAVDDVPEVVGTLTAEPGAPTTNGAGAARRVGAFRAPDATRPLPKRVAPGLAGPARRGEGVRAATPDHDYTQTYSPTVASVTEGVLARSHRIQTCADLHGVPMVPPISPESEAGELEVAVALSFLVHVDAGPSGADADLSVTGAPPELAACLTSAIGDMAVSSPGPDGLTAEVLIPLDIGE